MGNYHERLLRPAMEDWKDSYSGYYVETPDGRVGQPYRFTFRGSDKDPYSISVMFPDETIKVYKESTLKRIRILDYENNLRIRRIDAAITGRV